MSGAKPKRNSIPAAAGAKPTPPCTAADSFKWNPADYAANSAAQLAWAEELIARLSLRGDERILDVGCGDGKITALLARAVPRGRVIGIDASSEMIAHARKHHTRGAEANIEFLKRDARRLGWTRAFDLVFSNAALHWVDDHAAFLRSAAKALRPGGRLMISCGGRGNAKDVFTVICAEMRRVPWREFFRRLATPYFFFSPAEYRAWLPQAGFQPEVVRLVPKDAMYPGRDGFAAWLRTTWLPYTQRVPEARREEFIAAVTDRYLTRHPPDDAGQVHVRMVRLEIEALRI